METNTLLIQTLINKVDFIQQQLKNTYDEKNDKSIIDNIEEKTNCIFERIDELKASLEKQSQETIDHTTITQLTADIASSIDEKIITSNQFRKRWIQYSYIALVSLIGFIALNYSIRYYRCKGNSTKYEFIYQQADHSLKQKINKIDSQYEDLGDLRFRIKYMNE